MRAIPFTLYLLPNGRQVQTSIEVPDEISAMAQEIRARGNRFECEILTTGQVSLTVHNNQTEEDTAIEICANGPEVIKAVEKLVRTAYKAGE